MGRRDYGVTSTTLGADTTAIAVWCTGESAMINWWSTVKEDLATTDTLSNNGWIIVKDTAPQLLDRSLWEASGHWEKFHEQMFTIVDADEILVLDSGRIVESGTYQSLLDRGGQFAELAKRQLL